MVGSCLYWQGEGGCLPAHYPGRGSRSRTRVLSSGDTRRRGLESPITLPIVLGE